MEEALWFDSCPTCSIVSRRSNCSWGFERPDRKGRLRPGCPGQGRGRDQRTRQQPADRLPGSSTPTPGGIQGGFGSAMMLTLEDAAAIVDDGMCPTRLRWPPRRRRTRRSPRGRPPGRRPSSAPRPAGPRRLRSRTLSSGALDPGGGRGWRGRRRARPRHRRRAVQHRQSGGQTVTIDGRQLHGDRRPRLQRRIVDRHLGGLPGGAARSAPANRSSGPTSSSRRPSTSRPRRPTP